METLETNLTTSIFDTSALDVKKLSEGDFFDEVYYKLSRVLDEQFPTVFNKRQIKKETNGFNFACPCCGDSATNTSKKRAHISLRGEYSGYFKCYNCGAFMKISDFFKRYDNPISLGAVTYLNDNIRPLTTIGTQHDSLEVTAEVFNKELAMKYAINREYLKYAFGWQEISRTNPYAVEGYNYLVGRMQTNFKNFLYDYKNKYIIILNNVGDDKVIGLQIRDISGKRKQRYLSYKLDVIYHTLLRMPNIEIPSEINSLSNVFNVFNINIYKPVMLTEGPFDSFLLPNCIASAGASKTIPIDIPFGMCMIPIRQATNMPQKCFNKDRRFSCGIN